MSENDTRAAIGEVRPLSRENVEADQRMCREQRMIGDAYDG